MSVTKRDSKKWFGVGMAGVFGAMLLAVAGCNSAPSDQTVKNISEKPAKPAERVAAERTVLPVGQPAASQVTFTSPDDAVRALVMACESKDHGDFQKIFGPAAKDFMSGDPVEDENEFSAFADDTAAKAALEDRTADMAILHVGKEDWAFPIPIVKTKDGTWYFDTVAGETEILARRIGSNELDAISLCRTYVDAQREYASADRDGNEVLEYAQRLKSNPGKHDGLYWEKGANEVTSPFGPLIAEATEEGYGAISGSHATPTAYHGYYFHIMKAQGPAAPGGDYNYVINGHMIAGFAMVAYPAEYGKSGVMTFIVSHSGRVYQKDLGKETEKLASDMKKYNPDKSWTLVSGAGMAAGG